MAAEVVAAAAAAAAAGEEEEAACGAEGTGAEEAHTEGQAYGCGQWGCGHCGPTNQSHIRRCQTGRCCDQSYGHSRSARSHYGRSNHPKIRQKVQTNRGQTRSLHCRQSRWVRSDRGLTIRRPMSRRWDRWGHDRNRSLHCCPMMVQTTNHDRRLGRLSLPRQSWRGLV